MPNSNLFQPCRAKSTRSRDLSFDWLIGWLIDWLVGWLIDWLMDVFEVSVQGMFLDLFSLWRKILARLCCELLHLPDILSVATCICTAFDFLKYMCLYYPLCSHPFCKCCGWSTHPPNRTPPRNKGLLGLVNHWFPLIRPYYELGEFHIAHFMGMSSENCTLPWLKF